MMCVSLMSIHRNCFTSIFLQSLCVDINCCPSGLFFTHFCLIFVFLCLYASSSHAWRHYVFSFCLFMHMIIQESQVGTLHRHVHFPLKHKMIRIWMSKMKVIFDPQTVFFLTLPKLKLVGV